VTLIARLAALERRHSMLVVGIVNIEDGVESPVSVGGVRMSRAEFAERYAGRPHLLRIYERETVDRQPEP
jgi:hypothetical protein